MFFVLKDCISWNQLELYMYVIVDGVSSYDEHIWHMNKIFYSNKKLKKGLWLLWWEKYVNDIEMMMAETEVRK